MLSRWKIESIIPIIGAGVLIGCTANNPQNRVAESGPKQPDARRITLAGCVGSGPGAQQFVLTQVRMPPLAERPSDASSSTGQSITENSQVRLAMADDDQLRKLVGQTVELNGTVTDSGRNTVGTSGQERPANEPEPRSMSNGTFPEIVVQRISGTGEKCTPTRRARR